MKPTLYHPSAGLGVTYCESVKACSGKQGLLQENPRCAEEGYFLASKSHG